LLYNFNEHHEHHRGFLPAHPEEAVGFAAMAEAWADLSSLSHVGHRCSLGHPDGFMTYALFSLVIVVLNISLVRAEARGGIEKK